MKSGQEGDVSMVALATAVFAWLRDRAKQGSRGLYPLVMAYSTARRHQAHSIFRDWSITHRRSSTQHHRTLGGNIVPCATRGQPPDDGPLRDWFVRTLMPEAGHALSAEATSGLARQFFHQPCTLPSCGTEDKPRSDVKSLPQEGRMCRQILIYRPRDVATWLGGGRERVSTG